MIFPRDLWKYWYKYSYRKNTSLNSNFYDACLVGNLIRLELLLNKNEISHDGLRNIFFNICEYGHIELVDLVYNKLIESYTDDKLSEIERKNIYDCNIGIYHACIYGNIEIVKLLINKIKPNVIWHWIFEVSCSSGYVNILKFVFDNYNNYENCEWGNGLGNACYFRNIDVLNFLIDKSKILGITLNWQKGLHSSISANNYTMAKICIDNGAIFNGVIRSESLGYYYREGKAFGIEYVEYILKKFILRHLLRIINKNKLIFNDKPLIKEIIDSYL